MSLIDFAMFSKVSYNTEDYLAGDFNAWFPPSTGWAKTDYYAKASSVTFYRFDNSITNQTVVAVRGTASGSDVLSDVDIWMPIALFQGASILGPSFLQTSLIDILYWANFVERILRSDTGRFYYDDLDDYMKQVLKTKTADQVYLTGHSLGGGLSKIVGARRGVTAITFSSPGLYYTSRSVDVELDALRRVAVTLKPMKDAVPRVDDQAETVYQTDCDESVPTCHFITLTLCQLMHACGDPKGRGLKRDICPTALRV
jgi:pimeloyl-ACP methyl ester carboxylesterase